MGYRGVELVGIDQRGNQGYICEIGNNYTKKHICAHWPEILATSNVQRHGQPFFLFPYD